MNDRELGQRSESLALWAATKGLHFSPRDEDRVVGHLPLPFVNDIWYFEVQNVITGRYKNMGLVEGPLRRSSVRKRIR
jgi:hypothetical protein